MKEREGGGEVKGGVKRGNEKEIKIKGYEPKSVQLNYKQSQSRYFEWERGGYDITFYLFLKKAICLFKVYLGLVLIQYHTRWKKRKCLVAIKWCDYIFSI